MNRCFSTVSRTLAAALAFAIAALSGAAACDAPAALCAEPSRERFALIADGAPSAIYADTEDYPGVLRAVRNLQTDLASVAGAAGGLSLGGAIPGGSIVIVGTLDRSPTIARLAREGKIDARRIEGRWEAFLQQVVDEPMPGVAQALVIAGADKRGTIYGIYDLVERAGVSPWAWWADAPIKPSRELHVAPGARDDAPAVRYRGIFLNDENPALYGWANKTFDGFNHRFYERIFDLILRLKGNYLWPAMWGKAFYDDDPLNAPLADEMGVVIGTSHHEPLGRAHVEWSRYGEGPWDYTRNAAFLRAFWREGVERMHDYESIVTIGMRGDGDEPMTEETAIGLLQRIVADQRRIIADVSGRPASQTPQIWALYKEVQDYFDNGMDVPADVTLLFADDNWGNIRRLPVPGSTRKGGYGVYYHFDYVGGPRNYKWINTNQIERTWEQMHLAYEYGARQIWIVNVGDLKPMELPTSFFLDFAWKPADWPLERLPFYSREWAARTINEQHAGELAELLDLYTKYNARRKPELIDPDTFSLVSYRESERVVEEWRALAQRADALRAVMPKESMDAFLQLVWHPVHAASTLNELYRAVALNRLYAAQERVAANAMAKKARALFDRDAEITRFYHEDIADGKWDHMMSQTHIGYTGWQQPEENIMPALESYEAPRKGALGVAIEGDARAWPGADGQAALPLMDAFNRQSRTIEIYNRGRGAFRYRLASDAPWLRFSSRAGRVKDQTSVAVSVDWDAAPDGLNEAAIDIEGPDGASARVVARAFKPADPGAIHGYVESDGVVAMEASRCMRAVAAQGATWKEIPNLGRTGSGVAAFPALAPVQKPGAGARLEYDFHAFEAGELTVEITLAPTLDFKGQGGMRYAVSVGDEPPTLVNVNDDPSEKAWEAIVARNAHVRRTTHRTEAPGPQTIKLWLVDPGLVFQRIVAFRGDLPKSYFGPPESALNGTAACEGLAKP